MKELKLLEQARQIENEDQVLNSLSNDEAEIQKQFTVFYDPTFSEFIDIMGREHNEDLPLFCQLYVLK